jgi:hypothetical protein
MKWLRHFVFLKPQLGLDFIAAASLVSTQTQKTRGGASRRHSLLGF